MSDEVGDEVPKLNLKEKCPDCKVEGRIIGVGSASGRLQHHCDQCGKDWWGKNPAAMIMGSLGGKARAANLTPEERIAIAKKGGAASGAKRSL